MTSYTEHHSRMRVVAMSEQLTGAGTITAHSCLEYRLIVTEVAEGPARSRRSTVQGAPSRHSAGHTLRAG
ncbi:hypothetical protein ACLMAL_12175 [Nocardia sp. CWNU-33]|uniref:hypothetical protein n=1 Tax=Nocardia sp. CWNU-33 TaxID=3392117 RepID=UPI00398E5BBA